MNVFVVFFFIGFAIMQLIMYDGDVNVCLCLFYNLIFIEIDIYFISIMITAIAHTPNASEYPQQHPLRQLDPIVLWIYYINWGYIFG